MFPLFANGVIETGGKFAAGVVDIGGKLSPVLLTPTANLPLVSLTPVAYLPPVSTTLAKLVAKFAADVVDTGGDLDLQISLRIFEKIRNGSNGILWGWGGGKLIHENQKQRIS